MNIASQSTALFIGGIPPECSIWELSELFKEYSSEIKLSLPSTSSNLNRGYAFITAKCSKTAQRLLNSKLTLNGRPIHIQNRAPKQQGRSSNQLRLFLGGLPYKLTDEEIEHELSTFCKIRCAYAIRNKLGISKGFGFVHFWHEKDCRALLQYSSIEIAGRSIDLRSYSSKRDCLDSSQSPSKSKIRRVINRCAKLAHSIENLRFN